MIGWTFQVPAAIEEAARFDAQWTITFAVVVPLFDTEYTRMGMVRDPQGAAFTLSEYRPPAG